MRWVLVFLAGAGAGFLARELTLPDPAPPRVAARPAPERARDALPEAPRPAPQPQPAPAPVETPRPMEPAGGAATGPSDAKEGFAGLMDAQLPALKGYVGAAVRQKAREIGKRLGLDDARIEKLAGALADDATRQIEKMFASMTARMEGEAAEFEPDPESALVMQGVPGKLSIEAEHELAAFLSDREIESVRRELAEERARENDKLMEMQVAMMGISGLTESQRKEVKEALAAGGGGMKEGMAVLDAMKGGGTPSEEEIVAAMEKGFEPRREKLRHVLDAAQFEQYLAFEKRTTEQVRMSLKMLSGLRKPEKEAAKAVAPR